MQPYLVQPYLLSGPVARGRGCALKAPARDEFDAAFAAHSFSCFAEAIDRKLFFFSPRFLAYSNISSKPEALPVDSIAKAQRPQEPMGFKLGWKPTALHIFFISRHQGLPCSCWTPIIENSEPNFCNGSNPATGSPAIEWSLLAQGHCANRLK
jgi:hypothetical protein